MQNILDRVWGLWADDMGNETLLTSILAQTHADCEMCVGNPWCGASPNPNPNPNPSPNPNPNPNPSPNPSPNPNPHPSPNQVRRPRRDGADRAVQPHMARGDEGALLRRERRQDGGRDLNPRP